MKMEVIRSSETSVHTRSTQWHIPEDGIIQIAGGSNKLHSSSNIIRRIRRRAMRRASLAPCRGEKGNSYRILVGKPGEKCNQKYLGVFWENNIKTVFIQIGWVDMDGSG
jgi:hypothetical protein